MDVFFDTTVVVAALERSHPHFEQVLPVVRSVTQGHTRDLSAPIPSLKPMPRSHALGRMKRPLWRRFAHSKHSADF